jgi:hypothetical protein
MLIYKNSLCTQDRQGGRQKEKEIKGKEKGIMSNPNTVQIQSNVKISGWDATTERR